MSDTEEAVAATPDHEKTVTIIVNGRRKEVKQRELRFEDVVRLAFGDNVPSGPNIVITVTYTKGEDGRQGTLLPGDSVKVKAGMVFNVKATDKS
jgi:Multiubiquitin